MYLQYTFLKLSKVITELFKYEAATSILLVTTAFLVIIVANSVTKLLLQLLFNISITLAFDGL